MTRTAINFYLELVMFTQALLLGATGWTMEHLVGGGERRRAGEGVGSETFLWMDRDLWGEIHSTIAVTLVAAVAVHLVLHWNWIKVRVLEMKAGLTKTEAGVAQKQ